VESAVAKTGSGGPFTVAGDNQLLSNRYFPDVILGSSVLWMGTRGRGDMLYQVLQ